MELYLTYLWYIRYKKRPLFNLQTAEDIVKFLSLKAIMSRQQCHTKFISCSFMFV